MDATVKTKWFIYMSSVVSSLYHFSGHKRRKRKWMIWVSVFRRRINGVWAQSKDCTDLVMGIRVGNIPWQYFFGWWMELVNRWWHVERLWNWMWVVGTVQKHLCGWINVHKRWYISQRCTGDQIRIYKFCANSSRLTKWENRQRVVQCRI